MDPTLLQTVQGNGGGYVNVYTKVVTLTAGSAVTIAFGCGASDTFTITDVLGDTVLLDVQKILTGQRQVTVLHIENAHGGATTFTVQMGVGQFADTCYIIQEWSSMPSTSLLDKIVSASVASGTTYASGNTATTAQGHELLIGALCCDSNAPSFTGDAAWTNLITQAGFDLYTSLTVQYRIVNATGAYGWTTTNGSSRQASIGVATYKALVTSAIPNKAYIFSQAVNRASTY